MVTLASDDDFGEESTESYVEADDDDDQADIIHTVADLLLQVEAAGNALLSSLELEWNKLSKQARDDAGALAKSIDDVSSFITNSLDRVP